MRWRASRPCPPALTRSTARCQRAAALEAGEQEVSVQLVLVDAGLVTELSPNNKRNFVDLFSAVARGQGTLAARLMLERSSGHVRGRRGSGKSGAGSTRSCAPHTNPRPLSCPHRTATAPRSSWRRWRRWWTTSPRPHSTCRAWRLVRAAMHQELPPFLPSLPSDTACAFRGRASSRAQRRTQVPRAAGPSLHAANCRHCDPGRRGPSVGRVNGHFLGRPAPPPTHRQLHQASRRRGSAAAAAWEALAKARKDGIGAL